MGIYLSLPGAIAAVSTTIATTRTMKKEDYIIKVKQLRVDIDELMKRSDELFREIPSDVTGSFNDTNEVFANQKLAKRHLEDAGMRFGKVLQHMDAPNPYPNSRDTSNAKVDATADVAEKSEDKEDES